MLSYTKTVGFQTWEQEELNSAQFKTVAIFACVIY